MYTCVLGGWGGFWFCTFGPCRMACRILVPYPGIHPGPPAVEARSPNQWTAREVPRVYFFFLTLQDFFYVAIIHFRLPMLSPLLCYFLSFLHLQASI